MKPIGYFVSLTNTPLLKKPAHKTQVKKIWAQSLGGMNRTRSYHCDCIPSAVTMTRRGL